MLSYIGKCTQAPLKQPGASQRGSPVIVLYLYIYTHIILYIYIYIMEAKWAMASIVMLSVDCRGVYHVYSPDRLYPPYHV